MNNVTANVGDTVTLSCRIRGYPTPHYWWYRNDAYIQGNIGRMSVKNFTWGSRLRIRNVDTLDMGAFKCISENSAGSKTVIGKISLNPGKSYGVFWLVDILIHLLLCFNCSFSTLMHLFLWAALFSLIIYSHQSKQIVSQDCKLDCDGNGNS